MTLAEEGNRLRLEILRLGDSSKSRRYPEELRKKVLDWVERSKQSGMKEPECADLIDVLRQRFSSWRGEASGWRRSVRSKGEPKALVPVEVRSDASPFGPLSFVSPSGFRVEGLTITEAMALLRAFS